MGVHSLIRASGEAGEQPARSSPGRVLQRSRAGSIRTAMGSAARPRFFPIVVSVGAALERHASAASWARSWRLSARGPLGSRGARFRLSPPVCAANRRGGRAAAVRLVAWGRADSGCDLLRVVVDVALRRVGVREGVHLPGGGGHGRVEGWGGRVDMRRALGEREWSRPVREAGAGRVRG